MIQIFFGLGKWFYVQKKLKALKNTYYTSLKLNGKLMQILRASVKAYAAASRLKMFIVLKLYEPTSIYENKNYRIC